MDTEYTKGFKAGMVWREIEIIKLLEKRICFDHDNDCDQRECFANLELIALIKGEK